MGIGISRCYNSNKYETPIQLKAKVKVLEEEINRLNLVRELEFREYEEQGRLFESREEEWNKERREHREECFKLRKKLKECEEKIRSLEGELVVSRRRDERMSSNGWEYWVGTEYLVEHMKEEQAQREVAVEKWKHLYLTIKSELDDLIHRTKQGSQFGLGVEEGLIQRVQMELTAKEETIDTLQSRISSMEKEKFRREREIDILRQSLRILGSTKMSGSRRNKIFSTLKDHQALHFIVKPRQTLGAC